MERSAEPHRHPEPGRVTTWALVADRSNAEVVEIGAHDALTIVRRSRSVEGRMHERDLGTSAPGRTRDRAPEGARHAMEPRVTPHEAVAQDFARELARELDADRMAHRFDRLILAAEPHFLGLLRDALSDETRRLVAGEVGKHLLGVGDGDLAKHLREARAVR